jgi:hypothetical protein
LEESFRLVDPRSVRLAAERMSRSSHIALEQARGIREPPIRNADLGFSERASDGRRDLLDHLGRMRKRRPPVS